MRKEEKEKFNLFLDAYKAGLKVEKLAADIYNNWGNKNVN